MATPKLKSTDYTVLDATLADADWPLLHRLWKLGLNNEGIYALVRLRTAVRQRGDLQMDGFTADPRAQFARWLVAQGRLSEGA
jgi:hypothetical protein